MLQEDITKSNDSFERYKERLSNFSGEFELGLFIYIAQKSILWVLLFFALAFSAAYIYLRYTPPVFESDSIIQIQTNDQANKLLNVENITESSNGLAEGVELLRSQVFLKRVLSKLPLQVSYFAEGTFQAQELYTSSPYTVEVKINNPQIVGNKIYIDFNNEVQGIINYNFQGKAYIKNYTADKWINFPQIDLKITINNYQAIQEQQNLVKQNSIYFTVNDTNTLVNVYFPFVDVKLMNSEAKTILVAFRDFNPHKASDIVSTMTDEYNSFDLERKSESSKHVINFIDEQLDAVYERLKLSETSIQNFKKVYNVDENKDITLTNVARLNTLEDQIIALELEGNVLDKIESNINSSKSGDTYSLLAMLAGTQDQSNITASVASLNRLLIQKEEMLYQVTPTSEAVRAIDFQIDIQKKLLKESIKAIRSNINSRKEDLDKKTIAFRGSFHELPENEIEFSRLQRLFTINEKYYTLLLENKTEYSISIAGFVSNNVILKKASPSSTPVSPNRKTIYIAYILIATLISLVLIILRYLSHDEINSLNEITKQTSASISILGIVPKCKQDIPVSQLLVDKSPKSLIAEAFRSIRTNLQFISNEAGPKVIALTSTISGDGKTFVAINLGGIIAFSGKKVIILDLDMRKPKIHIGFNAQNSIGMSTLLIGKDTAESAIQHSNLENLDFITAGPIPPNPSELIISSKMDEIVAYLKTIYDVVIIDNPPVGLVSDGIAMIQKADYPIYIFRANYSKRNFVQNVDRLFNETHIKKLSVILNGVDIERKNYGYNYGYGYGYGYGYYDDGGKSPKVKKSFFKK
ncbi:MAG: polysaccharide biosynthesis tyrosine autokinase [Bacteroidetes bacterium]|nr:polysaccharide biosynthesis tyrosine autokinase [Bacteroidota bacterium]